MLTAYDVANWLIYKLNDLNEDISPLKLQKLLYYTQGISFKTTGKPIFQNEIEHWNQGPVVREVYFRYPNHTYDSIKFDSSWMTLNTLEPLEEKIINKVILLFGDLDAWELRNMTHNEDPWKNTEKNQRISKHSIKQYFESRFEGIDLENLEPLEYNQETKNAIEIALLGDDDAESYDSLDDYLSVLMADET